VMYTLSTGCSIYTTLTVNPLPASITGLRTVCIGSASTLANTSTGGMWGSSDPATATIGFFSGMLTGVDTGTTVITYMLPTGCFVTTTATVITTPANIAGPGAGNKVCVGNSMTLTDATAGGTWTSNNPLIATVGSTTGIVTGVAAGVTTIIYSLGTGCTVMTLVTINPLPAAITGPSSVCIGYTIALADATTGGAWSSANPARATAGSASGIVTGVAAGSVAITYSLPTGCVATKMVTVTSLPCVTVGLNEPGMATGSVNIFPNPANDELTVKMDESAYSSFTITNNVGQVMMQQQVSNQQTTVNVRALPAGMYYITLRGDNGTAVHKFMKM
jgi:uncharacterized protein YjdB